MELQVARDAEVEVERLLLEHHPDAGESVPRVAAHREPGDLDIAGVGREEAGQHLEQRRLARAVGPEQHDEAAARHDEAQRVEGDARAIALGEPAQLQHGAAPAAWSASEFSSLR